MRITDGLKQPQSSRPRFSLSNERHVFCFGLFCASQITEEGGVVISGRSDSVLNPGGVRIGTAEIYRQVVGVADDAATVFGMCTASLEKHRA